MDFKLFMSMCVCVIPECSTLKASCGGAKNQGSKENSAFMMVSSIYPALFGYFFREKLERDKSNSHKYCKI